MNKRIKSSLLFLILFFQTIVCFQAQAKPSSREYFELRVYHITNSIQEASIDAFLQKMFIPSLHSAGVKNVGVFKPISNDTAVDKRIYVFIPFKSVSQWEKYVENSNNATESSATDYTDAAYDKPPYARMESIFIRAFKNMPSYSVPKLNGPKKDQVFELRSYEGPTEKLFQSKVHMFNEGGETGIFSRLGFNPVFYGEVVHGARMPNLMYMTSFDNMASRTEHWKAFGSDPTWKALAAMKEYQHNVSKQDIIFCRPADYSEF